VVAADGKVESRQIAASSRVGNDWVVDRGLRSGDRVVVEGLGKLKPGMPVDPRIVASTSDGRAGTASAASSNVNQASSK